MSNYDLRPTTPIVGFDESAVVCGWQDICSKLAEECASASVVVVEAYPGVNDDLVLEALSSLNPRRVIDMRTVMKDEAALSTQLAPFLTDDRVFGRMCYCDLVEFMDADRLEAARVEARRAAVQDGLTIVYGMGARLVARGDVLVFLDMTRWEITKRYRAGMPNYCASNHDEDSLRKIKRGFFVEWRIADTHKLTFFNDVDFYIDTVDQEEPKLVLGDAAREGLRQIAHQPFRLVPYFDPGVWGGQWMKRVCGLDQKQENFAWSFDGVPEENSLLLGFGERSIELPAMDAVLFESRALLGDDVYARFGAEFPIRFDFLDTMGGQNLSLQVHPLTEYIHRQFGMAYTQDESYYLLDAGEDACVYLGLKDGVDPDEMFAALREANAGGRSFDAERFVNKFPAKKHDHFLIPAGTIHCSGSNAMVLEVSATPYIFTFKLWDWGRVGLDGLPRPVHLNHGQKVIQWNRTTDWVRDNLVNAVHTVHEDEHGIEEHTGLHELEFIETRRHWIEDEVVIDNGATVNMLNLIEGATVAIESLDGSFDPFEVHYAETFIVPASVAGYRIVNRSGARVGVLRAYVRKPQA